MKRNYTNWLTQGKKYVQDRMLDKQLDKLCILFDRKYTKKRTKVYLSRCTSRKSIFFVFLFFFVFKTENMTPLMQGKSLKLEHIKISKWDSCLTPANNLQRIHGRRNTYSIQMKAENRQNERLPFVSCQQHYKRHDVEASGIDCCFARLWDYAQRLIRANKELDLYKREQKPTS